MHNVSSVVPEATTLSSIRPGSMTLGMVGAKFRLALLQRVARAVQRAVSSRRVMVQFSMAVAAISWPNDQCDKHVALPQRQ
jgi:hypothetical protein